MSTSEQGHGARRGASRRARTVAAIALATLVGAAGCSSAGDPPPPDGINTGLPGNRGASCVDARADISGDADELGGSQSEPAGIDLVAAKATLTDSTLQVEFETAGPIDGTPQPEFILFQGDVSEVGRWELKARQNANNKAWELVLTTFDRDSNGRYVEHPGQKIDTPITVSGTKLSFEASQKAIPPAVSYVWAFGSSSGTEPTTVIDYCDNSTGATTGSTPGSTPGSTATPPTTEAVGALRQSQSTGRGETVTVYTVESPPEAPQAGATPPDPAPEQLPGDPTPVPFKLAVVDAKLCAPADRGITVGIGSFYVKDQDGANWPARVVDVPAHVPAFQPAAEGLALQADECKQGWVTMQLPETSTVTQVLYVVDPSSPDDALVWKV